MSSKKKKKRKKAATDVECSWCALIRKFWQSKFIQLDSILYYIRQNSMASENKHFENILNIPVLLLFLLAPQREGLGQPLLHQGNQHLHPTHQGTHHLGPQALQRERERGGKGSKLSSCLELWKHNKIHKHTGSPASRSSSSTSSGTPYGLPRTSITSLVCSSISSISSCMSYRGGKMQRILHFCIIHLQLQYKKVMQTDTSTNSLHTVSMKFQGSYCPFTMQSHLHLYHALP